MPHVHISRIGPALHSSTRLVLAHAPTSEGSDTVAIAIDDAMIVLSVADAQRLSDALAGVLAMWPAPAAKAASQT